MKRAPRERNKIEWKNFHVPICFFLFFVCHWKVTVFVFLIFYLWSKRNHHFNHQRKNVRRKERAKILKCFHYRPTLLCCDGLRTVIFMTECEESPITVSHKMITKANEGRRTSKSVQLNTLSHIHTLIRTTRTWTRTHSLATKCVYDVILVLRSESK